MRRQAVKADRELMMRVARARQTIGRKLLMVSRDPRYAASVRLREEFFGEISGVYERLAGELDAWFFEMTGGIATDWHKAALDDIREKRRTVASNVVSFDRSRVQRYWGLVNPENKSSIAAVFTEKMAAGDKQALRGAAVDVFRQGQLEAMTARETAKALQARWDEAAGNLLSDRFVDASGRRWTNAQYLQMLVRTTQQRVARESYIDTLVSHGDRIARIVPSGESCRICEAWADLIVRLSGEGDDPYPSYQEALDAGMFHPSCDCHLEYIDPLIDKTDIGRQAKPDNPDLSALEDDALTPAEQRRAATEAVAAYRERAVGS
jgi:hypothetical protein